MDLLTIFALLFLLYLVFQRWFWGLLIFLLWIGLGIGGIVALFAGQIGPGLGMLLIAWLIVQVFGGSQ